MKPRLTGWWKKKSMERRIYDLKHTSMPVTHGGNVTAWACWTVFWTELQLCIDDVTADRRRRMDSEVYSSQIQPSAAKNRLHSASRCKWTQSILLKQSFLSQRNGIFLNKQISYLILSQQSMLLNCFLIPKQFVKPLELKPKVYASITSSLTDLKPTVVVYRGKLLKRFHRIQNTQYAHNEHSK